MFNEIETLNAKLQRSFSSLGLGVKCCDGTYISGTPYEDPNSYPPFSCYRPYSLNRESEMIFKGFDLLHKACSTKQFSAYKFEPGKLEEKFPYERYRLYDMRLPKE